jgi:hypothetical protein
MAPRRQRCHGQVGRHSARTVTLRWQACVSFLVNYLRNCELPFHLGVDQVGVGAGVVAVAVVGVPLGLGVPALVVVVVGRVVGDEVGASVGDTVVGRAVGSFVGSRGDGVLVLVTITGVPPDGVIVTGGGRSHM